MTSFPSSAWERTPRQALPGNALLARLWIYPYPGNLFMPTFGIDVQMRGDRVRTFRAFFIEKAEFNLKLPDSDLSPTVPAQTRIIDKRNPNRPVGGIAEKPGDPVSLADEILANGKVLPVTPPSERKK